MRPRWQRIGLKVLYWLAVLVVSLALLLGIGVVSGRRDRRDA